MIASTQALEAARRVGLAIPQAITDAEGIVLAVHPVPKWRALPSIGTVSLAGRGEAHERWVVLAARRAEAFALAGLG